MSGLLTHCQEYFGVTDLYEVLGIARNAEPSEVKKAYRQLSLKVHPDRVQLVDKDLSTRKFQTLSRVYCLLSDKEKRAVYDETGDVGDEGDVPEDRDWTAYWRLLFPKVTPKMINDFENEYRSSSAEVEDLKQAYICAKGDMGKIIDNVMCAREEDEDRFRSILDPLVADGTLPKFKSYVQPDAKRRAVRKKKAADEAAEAKEHAKRLGLGSADGAGGSDLNSLHALIQRNKASRQSQMDSLLSAMEAKYSTMDDDDDVIDIKTGKKVRRPAAAKGKASAAVAAGTQRSTSSRAANSKVKAKHSH